LYPLSSDRRSAASHPLSPRRMHRTFGPHSLPVVCQTLPGGVHRLSVLRPPQGHIERFLLNSSFHELRDATLRSKAGLRPVFSATPLTPMAPPFFAGMEGIFYRAAPHKKCGHHFTAKYSSFADTAARSYLRSSGRTGKASSHGERFDPGRAKCSKPPNHCHGQPQ
jgi:hypothetical protein